MTLRSHGHRDNHTSAAQSSQHMTFIGRMKAGMPEPVFAGILSGAIEPSLSAAEFASCLRGVTAQAA